MSVIYLKLQNGFGAIYTERKYGDIYEYTFI